MPEIKAEDFVRLATLFVPETANAIAFSPDGSLLAVAAADKVFVFKVPEAARTGQRPDLSPRGGTDGRE